MEIINNINEIKKEYDIPPIEYSLDWINMVNEIKKEYNVDGIHTINYETDKPEIIIYKYGYPTDVIWRIAPTYKRLLRQPSKFRGVVQFIKQKIEKQSYALKMRFHDDDDNIYETNGFNITNKLKEIVNEEILHIIQFLK